MASRKEEIEKVCQHEFDAYHLGGGGMVKCCRKCDGFLPLDKIDQSAEVESLRAERDKALGELAAARAALQDDSMIERYLGDVREMITSGLSEREDVLHHIDWRVKKAREKRLAALGEKQPEQPAAARESELDNAVAHLAGIIEAVERERDFCFALVEGCHDLRIVQDVTGAYLKRREKRRALAEKPSSSS